jgi:hypothetical protein
VVKILMGLLLRPPMWPEVGAIALSLESIRGLDPEAGFEGRAHQGGAAVGRAMIVPEGTLAELGAAAGAGVTEFYLALLGSAAPAMPAA